MSSQNGAMKRLLALEEQNRLDAQVPLLEDLATATGISVAEIMAEVERVQTSTAHLNDRQRLGWIADDCGMSVAELEDEADLLLDGLGNS